MAGWVDPESLAQAADHFQRLAERQLGLMPHRQMPVLLSGLAHLTGTTDDAAGRAALLRVLGRLYRRLGLHPAQHASIADALTATMTRFGRTGKEPEAARPPIGPALAAVARHAETVGAGPAWWAAEVITHTRPTPGIAILTVRPQRRLPYRAGEAIPVSLPDRLPGVWRWYSPANAPRDDGLIELHVRAVAGGTLSRLLVEAVRPGERLWLGPALDVGLSPRARTREAQLLLIAGGTGLAPLRALVEQLAASTVDRALVTLIVGARALGELYDPIALDKLQCAHDRWLAIRPVFSHDPCVEAAERGTAVHLALRHLRPGQEIYVCGSPAMVRVTQLRLLVEGVPASRIHLPVAFTSPDPAQA